MDAKKMPRTVYRPELIAFKDCCFQSMFESHYFLERRLSSWASRLAGVGRPVAASHPAY